MQNVCHFASFLICRLLDSSFVECLGIFCSILQMLLIGAGKIVDAAPVPELIEKYAPGQGLEDVYLNVFGEGDGK